MVVAKRDCYFAIVEGSLPKTDLDKFDSALTEAVLEVNTALSTKFEEVVALSMGVQEYITVKGSVLCQPSRVKHKM